MAAAPIANKVLVANLGKIADKQSAAPVVVAPPVLLSGEGRGGMAGYSYSLSLTRPRTTISRGDFGDECKFIYS